MKKRHSKRYFEKRVKINPFSLKHCNENDGVNECIFVDEFQGFFCGLYRKALFKGEVQIVRCFECRRDERLYEQTFTV